MEKEYTFYETNHPLETREVKVKESELKDVQKNLLLGSLIKDFNNLPNELQIRFIELIINNK